MNIRCCCDANLVLGRIDLKIDPRVSEIRFPLKDGRVLTLPIEKAAASIMDAKYRVDYKYEWAIKSNDTPIEVLRQIPGWIKVNRVIPPASE